MLLETETDTERRENVLAARFRDTERHTAGVGLSLRPPHLNQSLPSPMGATAAAGTSVPFILGKFGSIPLKDHHFGSIPLLSHLHVGPHESMTCGVHGIYLKFGSFNGIDPIVPFRKHQFNARVFHLLFQRN